MNSSIQREKENPIVTLKAQAKKFDFSKLRADKGNAGANSGEATYLDFDRMDFVINEKDIDKNFINQLYVKHASLIEDDKNGAKNYRPFVKEVFKEMFKYAEAQVPSNSILEELVTNCNQAGYEAALFTQISPEFCKYGLTLQSPVKMINIDCTDANHITVKSDMVAPVVNLDDPEEELCKLDSSLEFTLESQDGKDGVTYKDGKLSLTVPEELGDYPVVNEMQQSKSLFDVIKEIFFKLIEKIFGHTNDIEVIEENGTITMTSGFGKPLKIKSTLKEVKLPMIDSSKQLH